MLPSSSIQISEDAEQSMTASSGGATSERQRRKRRLQLSCGECRKKKMQLSCDRDLPCRRCVRSGRPNLCSFQTGTEEPLVSNNQFSQGQAQFNSDEIRNLRAEVAQLRESLSDLRLQQKSDRAAGAVCVTDKDGWGQAVLLNGEHGDSQTPTNTSNAELSDPMNRSPSAYYIIDSNKKEGFLASGNDSALLTQPEKELFEKLEQDYKDVKCNLEEQATVVQDIGDSRSERDEEIWSSYKLPPKKELAASSEDATDPKLVRILVAAKAVLKNAYRLCSDTSPNRKIT
ncbi:hypothetical protein EG329_002444 [Mollisiaceae sp. DMI_Dod_QoI]|nr:hypothetical protein EG329_002444 [Helotiales sp. DMI_Dod_QoI]